MRQDQWLAMDGQQRRILIELDHAEGTVYISDAGYISRPSPNKKQIYEGCLMSDSGFEVRIDGSADMGEIEVVNGGYRDDWLALDWVGQAIRVYLGDKRWKDKGDFMLVALMRNNGISDANETSTTFAVADANTIFDTKDLGSLVFGSPFNVAPELIDFANHKFGVSSEPLSNIVARVNGSAITITPDLPNGSFTMRSKLSGSLHADPNSEVGTPAEIATWIAEQYGVPVNANNMDQLPVFKLGLYYSDEVNGSTILTDISTSIGGYWHVNVLGELEIYQITEPAREADFALRPGDIVDGGLRLIKTEAPFSKITIAYKKNFNVISAGGLAESVDGELANKLTTEWQYTDEVIDGFGSMEEVVRETYLVDETDAVAERVRRAILRGQYRFTFQIECRLTPALAKIGQTVNITYSGLGFKNGKNALVIGVSRELSNSKVILDVWL